MLQDAHRGRQAAGHGDARAADRRPRLRRRRQGHRRRHVHGSPRSSSDEFPSTIGLSRTSGNIWGIPYKADVKSTIWYPIKAFAAKGYAGPQDVGRADRPVRQDRRRRQPTRGASAPAAPARRPAGQLTDWVEEVVLKTEGLDWYNDWISHKITFDDPRRSRLPSTYVGKICSPTATSTAVTRPSSTDRPKTSWIRCSPDDNWTAHAGCWMQKIPTWYGPDFFPDKRASLTRPTSPCTSSARTSGSSRSRRSTRRRAVLSRVAGDTLMVLTPSAPSPPSRRCGVPGHARGPRGLDRAAAAPSAAERDDPGRLVCRRLQAQGRERHRRPTPPASASTPLT